MVDWSGGNDTGPTPRKDAIWVCEAGREPLYFRNRGLVEEWLDDLIEDTLTSTQRLCVGFDFPFGYPAGFARALTTSDDPLKLWDWFADRIEDAPRANNRFDVAGEINQAFGGRGPFWGNGLKRDIPGLPRTKRNYESPFADRRAVELLAKGSFTCWQMSGVGSVGGQVMMGLPVLSRLHHRWPGQIAAWPFEPLKAPIALLEIWPSLTVGAVPDGWIKDAWQVASVANDLAGMDPKALAGRLDISAPEEGWIFGIRQNR
ncbi:molybdopterin guanine dinucleotide synthesis [Aliisedimentitalea scapharcae]|uniref:Molybdopterin guanine dinucleotide synthesis n=1 Tax=Aliisedimentitalea scapharcae TaxID=1524259 RepID=A0ABZ2XYN0_9RHOB